MNKNALLRYRVINRMLYKGKYATKNQLLHACREALGTEKLSSRSIDADIAAMRNDERLGYFAPIKHEKDIGYYYEDPDYSIDKFPFNKEEVDSLLFASRLFEQFRDVEIFASFANSASRLREKLMIQNSNQNWENNIEFEKAELLTGSEFLNEVIEALKEKTVLSVKYLKFSEQEPTINIVHPCLLKEYRNRWYLIGYNPEREGIRTYAIDRIKELRPTGEKYIDCGFRGSDYYKNVVGVSVLDEEPISIRIAFSPRQALYLQTQPLHHSQKKEGQENGRLIFSFFLVPNYEFYSHLLAWGAEGEVLEPQKVRENVLNIAKKVTRMYG
jgi:predicted DNA-binding transcriptional regulator YafY